MRVNIYSQELTTDIELVEKAGYDEKSEPAMFQGVRLYLHSPELLHHTPLDDDRSAVTIWLPKSKERRRDLALALSAMSALVEGTAR